MPFGKGADLCAFGKTGKAVAGCNHFGLASLLGRLGSQTVIKMRNHHIRTYLMKGMQQRQRIRATGKTNQQRLFS